MMTPEETVACYVESTQATMEHLRRNGRVYSTVPFGFDRDGDMLIVNKTEMRVIRQLLL